MAKSALKVYGTYNFIDKDPVIDRMRGYVKSTGMTYSQIEDKSGVSSSTIYNWFDGGTKRPQYATVMAVMGALGYKITYTKK
jgi:DNA-binding phage protein